MDFRTGSVVVPFTSDTMARFCPVMALMRLDFPAFLLPKIPIWIRSEAGTAFKLIGVPPGLESKISPVILFNEAEIF